MTTSVSSTSTLTSLQVDALLTVDLKKPEQLRALARVFRGQGVDMNWGDLRRWATKFRRKQRRGENGGKEEGGNNVALRAGTHFRFKFIPIRRAGMTPVL